MLQAQLWLKQQDTQSFAFFDLDLIGYQKRKSHRDRSNIPDIE
jgi:hypothetical protein